MSINYKLIIWLIVVFALAFGFWGYVDYVLNVITPESFDFDQEPQPIVNFILQTALIVIGFALFRRKRWSMAMAGVISLAFLFKFGLTYLNFLGIGIFFVFMLGSRTSAVQEIDERTKVNTRLILRRGLPGVIIGYFVLISFAAYQSPVVEAITETERLPSASVVFIKNVVDGTIGPRVEGEEREIVVAKVATDTVGSINTFLKPYFQYAPPALAFGLFLVLWGLSFIFIWASVFIGMLVFWILKKTKFITIEERDIKAETLKI